MDLAESLRAGNRRALSRAITLVESTRPDHRAQANALLRALGGARRAMRIGLTGTPGVGKSTFTESFGLMLTGQGLRVAVLAVDPSSARSGGSILGDKTRMDRLARDPNAFIRPSPAAAQLGGLARRSWEVAGLFDAAGFDVVIAETVGVGQSETAVAAMTDLFVLLIAPAGGDELQGVKRGIMEVADLVLVNKADGDLAAQASATRTDYAGALRLMRPRPGDPDGWPRARTVSAITGQGLAEAWDDLKALHAHRAATGALARTRAAQAAARFDEEVRAHLLARLETDPALAERRAALAAEVAEGRPPAEAAATLLDAPRPPA